MAINIISVQYNGVCVCVFSSHSFWRSSSLDVPAGVTQQKGHTGVFTHLPSAVRALILLARRIQPFLSLVDREVEFLYTTDLQSFSTCWANAGFLFSFYLISLIADGPHHYHPTCGHRGSSHLSRVHALQCFYRDASLALLQFVNQWLDFTYSRSHAFRYKKKKHKSYYGKNRTHDFSTSRDAGYLLPGRPLGRRVALPDIIPLT